MIDISEEEVKKEDNSFEINEYGEIIRTGNEDTFDQSTLELSFATLVSDLKLSGFEQASNILKELPRDALLSDKQNDYEPQNEQEEEEK